MGEALLGDLVPVLAGDDLLEVAFDRGVAGRVGAEVLQDPAGVEFRTGFDDAGDHQIAEHLIADDSEAELLVHVGHHLAQQHRSGGFGTSRLIDPRGFLGGVKQCLLTGGQGFFDRDLGCDIQIESLLVGFEPCSGAFEEHPEFEVGVGGADMCDDLLPAVCVSGDLHGRGPEFGAHLPDKRHPPSVNLA